jgi:EAL domain-containing protein (putative c-di-GMP-specific phosphodiesterase class I)
VDARVTAARRRVVDMLSTPDQHQAVFQPILSLADARVVGYEGLSRFAAEPVRPPDQWFAEATRVGLGAEFQAAAIERVLGASAAARLPDESFVSVNVSPRCLAHPAVAAALGLADPSALVIELTEEEGVDSYATLRRAMAPYLERGVRFAVDDAGAGFASMRHITELGPAFVKLDANLVRGLHTRHALQAFLRALNGFTIEIGAVLIAEGVEQTTDLALLTQMGFPVLAQGYAIARPGPPWPRVSASARRAWLAASSGRPAAQPAAPTMPGNGEVAAGTGRPDS